MNVIAFALAIALGLFSVAAARPSNPHGPVANNLPVPLCNPDDPTCSVGGN